MNPSLYNCKNCGASLSLEQLRGTDCPYCKMAFPHQARANEQAVLVNQIMAQQIAASGAGAWMGGAAGQGAQLPRVPQQYGVTPSMNAPLPMSPYGAQIVNQQLGRAVGASIGIMMFVILGVLVALFVVGGAIAYFMVRAP